MHIIMQDSKKIYNEVPTITLKHSNDGLINMINSGKKILISRMGEETGGLAILSQFNKLPDGIKLHEIITLVTTYAGIYSKDSKDYKDYAELYFQILLNSSAISYFPPNISQLRSYTEVNFFNNFPNIPPLHNETLEPYYAIMDGITPWTHSLIDKKVLIVHPFVESFQNQLKNTFEIFPGKPIFLENQKFVFYKPYNTAAGNHIHKNWKETFQKMCSEIAVLDFDIALLGCGGYGIPLSGFIYDSLGKSAIYVGGGLQLLFGVMGERWNSTDMWKDIIKENDCKFIRPSKNENLPNKELLGDCYW